MPYSKEEHVIYTNNEYNTLPYYIKLFDILKFKNIKSYIDIGANVGETCNIYFDKLPTLEKAYLFEVDTENYNFLCNNIKYPKKVDAKNIAIYYGNETPFLFKNFNVGGHIVSMNSPAGFNNFGNVLNYSTLENLNLPPVDLIKIDIEGGEYEIIEKSSYLHTVKYIEIEFHYDSLDILQYIFNNFKNYNIILEEDIKGRFLFESKYL